MLLRLLVPALLLVAALAGCGSAAGGDVRLRVTRDFGARAVEARIVREPAGDPTAAELAARRFDAAWSLYVNGVERARDTAVRGGDSVWWDRRPPAAPPATAVVGAYPEPFLHGVDGKRLPVVLECADDARDACAAVADRLGAAGAIPARQALGTGTGAETLRVLVGRWRALRGDPALAQLDRGPRASGVYARFADDGRTLALLDPAGATVRTLAAGAGLVAATRFEQQAPTWTITGTDAAGVAAAARTLDERRLRGRFALATGASGALPLPLASR